MSERDDSAADRSSSRRMIQRPNHFQLLYSKPAQRARSGLRCRFSACRYFMPPWGRPEERRSSRSWRSPAFLQSKCGRPHHRHSSHRRGRIDGPSTLGRLSRAAPHFARPRSPCWGLLRIFLRLTGVGGGVFLAPQLIALEWTSPRQAATLSPPFILANSVAGLAGVPIAGQRFAPSVPIYAIAADGCHKRLRGSCSPAF